MERGGKWNDMSLGLQGRGGLRTSLVCPASSSEWSCRYWQGGARIVFTSKKAKIMAVGPWHILCLCFCVFQHISVSWWRPWVWQLGHIACGATVPTKPSCLCGSFWLQLTPWLSRWGCGCPSRFLASRQLSLLCRDPLSLQTAKGKKKKSIGRKTFADNTLFWLRGRRTPLSTHIAVCIRESRSNNYLRTNLNVPRSTAQHPISLSMVQVRSHASQDNVETFARTNLMQICLCNQVSLSFQAVGDFDVPRKKTGLPFSILIF